jgi:hypothetical protein
MSSSKLEKEDSMPLVNPSSEERMDINDNQNPSLMETPMSSSSRLSNKAPPQLNSTAPQKVFNPYTQSAKKQKTVEDHPKPSPTLTPMSLSSQLEKGAQRPHPKQHLTTPSDDQKRQVLHFLIRNHLVMKEINVC